MPAIDISSLPLFEGPVIYKDDTRAMCKAFEDCEGPTAVRQVVVEDWTGDDLTLENLGPNLDLAEAEFQRLIDISKGFLSVVRHRWGFTPFDDYARNGLQPLESPLPKYKGLVGLAAKVDVIRPSMSLKDSQARKLDEVLLTYIGEKAAGTPFLWNTHRGQCLRKNGSNVVLVDIDPLFKLKVGRI